MLKYRKAPEPIKRSWKEIIFPNMFGKSKSAKVSILLKGTNQQATPFAISGESLPLLATVVNPNPFAHIWAKPQTPERRRGGTLYKSKPERSFTDDGKTGSKRTA